MSFSGKMAYRGLRWMTTLFPSMKEDFTDIDTELEKARRINEKNKYVFPSDKKSRYKTITIDEYPCLIIRSKNTENKRNKGMAVWYPIYPPITEVNITVTISVLYDTYCTMVKKYGAENIAVIGDSMGGLFAAGIINHINRERCDVDMPKLFIANSPAGVPDTKEDWEELEKYASIDPLFTVNAFRGIGLIAAHGQETPKDMYCPRYMYFHNAPETYMYFAEEVCAGNARAYRAAYDNAGVGNRLHIHIQPEMMHGYSCVPIFPESKKIFHKTIRLLKEV